MESESVLVYEQRVGGSWDACTQSLVDWVNTNIANVNQILDITATTTSNTDECLFAVYYTKSPNTVMPAYPKGTKLSFFLHRGKASWVASEKEVSAVVESKVKDRSFFRMASACSTPEPEYDNIIIIFYWVFPWTH